jgi:hypothetical protein
METHFLGLVATYREKYDEVIKGENISVEHQNSFKRNPLLFLGSVLKPKTRSFSMNIRRNIEKYTHIR